MKLKDKKIFAIKLVDFYFIKFAYSLAENEEERSQLKRLSLAFLEQNETEITRVINKHGQYLGICSNIGGPYHTTPDSKIRVWSHLSPSYIQVTIDEQVAGYVSLLEDVCGIDNMKFFIDIYFERELKNAKSKKNATRAKA